MDDRNWRPVKGYPGYEISVMRQVRSWRGSHGRLKKPKLLTQYRKTSGKSNPYVVKLHRGGGHYSEVHVIRLMVESWLGGRPEGMVAYHKNGQLDDNCLNNIGFCTRQQLGRMTGADADIRRPVEKLDPRTLRPVEVYGSAREAGRKNFMSYQTILDRCNRPEGFRSPVAPDGYIYRWEKE